MVTTGGGLDGEVERSTYHGSHYLAILIESSIVLSQAILNTEYYKDALKDKQELDKNISYTNV
jgi:hypothetical protein